MFNYKSLGQHLFNFLANLMIKTFIAPSHCHGQNNRYVQDLGATDKYGDYVYISCSIETSERVVREILMDVAVPGSSDTTGAVPTILLFLLGFTEKDSTPVLTESEDGVLLTITHNQNPQAIFGYRAFIWSPTTEPQLTCLKPTTYSPDIPVFLNITIIDTCV